MRRCASFYWNRKKQTQINGLIGRCICSHNKQKHQPVSIDRWALGIRLMSCNRCHYLRRPHCSVVRCPNRLNSTNCVCPNSARMSTIHVMKHIVNKTHINTENIALLLFVPPIQLSVCVVLCCLYLYITCAYVQPNSTKITKQNVMDNRKPISSPSL